MVYLRGSGTMKFVATNPTVTDNRIVEFQIKPHSLVFFHNARWSHEVRPDATDPLAPRVMLGPFSFSGEEKQMLVRAGDCGGCGGCGGCDGSSDCNGFIRSGHVAESECGWLCNALLTSIVLPCTIPCWCYWASKKYSEAKKKREQDAAWNAQWKRMQAHRPPGLAALVQADKEVPKSHMVAVTVPNGAYPGDTIMVVHEGKQVQAPVPAGLAPGQTFHVSVPAARMKSLATGNTGVQPANRAVLGTTPTEKDQFVVDRAGTKYLVQRPPPALTEQMLEGVEDMEVQASVEFLRGVLATIGMARIKSLVRAYDEDKSGGLCRQEFRKIVKRMTLSKPTPEQIQALETAIFRTAATPDHLVLAEIEAYIFGKQLWLHNAFADADVDESGTLDAAEVRTIVVAILSQRAAPTAGGKVDHIVRSCMQGRATIDMATFQAWVMRSAGAQTALKQLAAVASVPAASPRLRAQAAKKGPGLDAWVRSHLGANDGDDDNLSPGKIEALLRKADGVDVRAAMAYLTEGKDVVPVQRFVEWLRQ